MSHKNKNSIIRKVYAIARCGLKRNVHKVIEVFPNENSIDRLASIYTSTIWRS